MRRTPAAGAASRGSPSPPAPANVKCSAAARSSLSSSALLWCVRSTDCDPSTAGCDELGRGRLAAAGDHECLAVRAERPLAVEALGRQRARRAARRGDGEDRLVGPVLGVEVDRRAVRRPCQRLRRCGRSPGRFRSSRRSRGRSASGASDPIRAPAIACERNASDAAVRRIRRARRRSLVRGQTLGACECCRLRPR